MEKKLLKFRVYEGTNTLMLFVLDDNENLVSAFEFGVSETWKLIANLSRYYNDPIAETKDYLEKKGIQHKDFELMYKGMKKENNLLMDEKHLYKEINFHCKSKTSMPFNLKVGEDVLFFEKTADNKITINHETIEKIIFTKNEILIGVGEKEKTLGKEVFLYQHELMSYAFLSGVAGEETLFLNCVADSFTEISKDGEDFFATEPCVWYGELKVKVPKNKDYYYEKYCRYAKNFHDDDEYFIDLKE